MIEKSSPVLSKLTSSQETPRRSRDAPHFLICPPRSPEDVVVLLDSSEDQESVSRRGKPSRTGRGWWRTCGTWWGSSSTSCSLLPLLPADAEVCYYGAEEPFDDEDSEETWEEFDAETQVDQKQRMGTARPCKCLEMLLISNLTFTIFCLV